MHTRNDGEMLIGFPEEVPGIVLVGLRERFNVFTAAQVNNDPALATHLTSQEEIVHTAIMDTLLQDKSLPPEPMTPKMQKVLTKFHAQPLSSLDTKHDSFKVARAEILTKRLVKVTPILLEMDYERHVLEDLLVLGSLSKIQAIRQGMISPRAAQMRNEYFASLAADSTANLGPHL